MCCRGTNKVADTREAPPAPAPAPAGARRLCCGRGWCGGAAEPAPDRRDSILSQPRSQPPSCWSRMLCCKKKDPSIEASRRTSMFSKKRSLSQAVPLEDRRSKLDPSLIEHTSMLRGAIPALPVPLAWVCLAFNTLLPGFGTICSGLFNLCFGRPRFGPFDGWKPRLGAFVINIIVGIGQLFTVLFCLVGWGWSIWWATIMIKVARKYRKLRRIQPDPEHGAAAINNHRNNHT